MSEITGEGTVACALSLVDKMFVDTEHLSSGVSFNQNNNKRFVEDVYLFFTRGAFCKQEWDRVFSGEIKSTRKRDVVLNTESNTSSKRIT